MNAGASPTGQAFAIRNCDALFSMTPKGKLDEFAAHVGNVKALARQGGREIDVYTVGVVTCRPTQREADAKIRWRFPRLPARRSGRPGRAVPWRSLRQAIGEPR